MHLRSCINIFAVILLESKIFVILPNMKIEVMIDKDQITCLLYCNITVDVDG